MAAKHSVGFYRFFSDFSKNWSSLRRLELSCEASCKSAHFSKSFNNVLRLQCIQTRKKGWKKLRNGVAAEVQGDLCSSGCILLLNIMLHKSTKCAKELPRSMKKDCITWWLKYITVAGKKNYTPKCFTLFNKDCPYTTKEGLLIPMFSNEVQVMGLIWKLFLKA